MLLPIHVVAGGLALVLGALALAVRKGGPLHRRSGVLFVFVMMVMALSAAALGNVGGGLMTIYFVLTAWLTVRADSPSMRRMTAVGCVFAAVFSVLTATLGVKAYNTPSGFLNGAPYGMLFFLSVVIALAAAGDARVLRYGVPRGGKRLARHLWRMCFSLFIAAGSFFAIKERVEKVLPDPFTTPAMRVLPILLLFGAMFYWLWRVRGRGAPAAARS